MAEIRRNRRLIESVDPVTGARTYTDELTGEIVAQDQAGDAAFVSRPATEVTETSVTERLTPGQPYAVGAPSTAANEQVVTQRTVTGTAAPAAVSTHETEVTTDDPYAARRNRAFKIQQAIYLLFGILEGLLAIRFALKLLGANPQSGFASFIYGVTAPFMAPFAGLFGQPALGGTVIEWNALVAIVAYALLAWVLAKLVSLIAGETRSGVRTNRVNTRIDQ